METDHYSLMCYDGIQRIFKCQQTQTLTEDTEVHSEVDLDIDNVNVEATDNLEISNGEYIESREDNESLNSDNIRKSVAFRKTLTEFTAPAKYVDDEYGMESAPESSDEEKYPTREEYVNSEWLNKPISNWINYAYVNIPNMLDKVDNFKNVKYETDICNNFDFPYVLQVVKDVCCRNNLEKLKLSSLAQIYAKRIAIADGTKNCKFCGRILQSSSLTKSFYVSNEEYCCDQYHRLFRLAVNYSELLYKRYRQQQQQRSYNKEKLTELKKHSLENQFNESSTNIQTLESELLSKLVNLSLADTTGNISLDNEESECTGD
ncbi:Glutamate-rich protein 6B [Schistosoma japonicum]|nr:Glutamate-rich protein 6B [Schistosoma japonicum]